MNSVSMQSYTDYSGYMNKDNLYANMRPVNPDNFNLKQKDDDIKKVEEVSKTNKTLDISSQEAVALYYNHQANEAMKLYLESSMDSSSSNESDELSLKDIHEIQKSVRRTDALDLYASQQNNDTISTSTYETWA